MSNGTEFEKVLNLLANETGVSYSRIDGMAKRIMVELIRAGRAEFILLRDDEINKWWTSQVIAAASKIKDYEEKLELYKIKSAAYEKLSEEDRKILGVRKPTKPKALKY